MYPLLYQKTRELYIQIMCVEKDVGKSLYPLPKPSIFHRKYVDARKVEQCPLSLKSKVGSNLKFINSCSYRKVKLLKYQSFCKEFFFFSVSWDEFIKHVLYLLEHVYFEKEYMTKAPKCIWIIFKELISKE